jgi:putative copper export protein
MQRLLAILGHWLHGLAFALWFGGILAIGGVAPAVYHAEPQVRGTPLGLFA